MTIDDMLAEEFSRSLRHLIVQMGSNSDIPYEAFANFSCSEAEAFADVLRLGSLPLDCAEGGAQAAAMVIAAHAVADEEGEQHYVDADTVVTTWEPESAMPRKWWLAIHRPGTDGLFRALRIAGPDGTPHGPEQTLHIASVEPWEQ